MEIIAILVLASIVAGQWLLIWRLTDRLLMQSHIPSLGPVRSSPPSDAEELSKETTRRKLFSVPIHD